MYESDESSAIDVGWLDAVLARLVADAPPGAVLTPAQLIDQISVLQSISGAVQAAQARRTAEFADLRQAELAPTGTQVQRDRARRDIAAQIGLARRVGPHLGARLVGVARVLTREMPCTMAAFRQGRIDEYQATLLVAETATLSLEHRRVVDAELAGRLGSLSAKEAQRAAAQIGYRLDAEQAVRRARRGFADRRVTVRPAPDSMTYLTALLPAVEGVGVYAALRAHAASATAAGDPRGTGALMVDELVSRLLEPARVEVSPFSSGDVGPTVEIPSLPTGLQVEIQLVMTDRTLFDGDPEPAVLTGYGPVPAPLARRLIREADPATTVWVRRLYTDTGGRLSDCDARRRLFNHTARRFLVARDQICRTPWCDAPIRHADHTLAHAAGGATDLRNGAGRCAACNQAKEGPGWRTAVGDDGSILTTTPTGHRHRSRPPDPPRSPLWAAPHPAEVA